MTAADSIARLRGVKRVGLIVVIHSGLNLTEADMVLVSEDSRWMHNIRRQVNSYKTVGLYDFVKQT